MIPRANITAWRSKAPWPSDAQVEQDLVLSRVLVEIFSRPGLAESLVVRGGTAFHKLFFRPPGRYSEDIDLVQREAGPIGPLIDGIREALDPWLGTPKRKRAKGRFTLYYQFDTTLEPIVSMRVKVEINTREHFSVQALESRVLGVESPWYSDSANVTSYALSELLGTKLRALYQRKKGRDLFDLWLGLSHDETAIDDVLASFGAYMSFVGAAVTRARFEANMAAKMRDEGFLGDLPRLLRPGLDYDVHSAWAAVHETLVARLPGEAWKGA